ncbi:MAG: ABC transporter permease [Bacteroidia bacterium]|nr:ABC transporter permease [Bacteroidia bacterium]
MKAVFNFIPDIIYHIGRYTAMLGMVFSRPEKYRIYYNRFMEELFNLGIGSIGIVSIVSLFMGAVITIQGAYNFSSPWIPLYAVGLATRDTMILEFSPTIISVILCGKVGSSIAGEIGTMRVTEQIDALEIMGVNSRAFLILPKIFASVIFNPVLVTMSMVLGIFGGWIGGVLSGATTTFEYVYGITYLFVPYYVTYALTKTVVFAFLISSVSAYHGYYTEGGALEVGKASTKAVVYSILSILIANYFLTQLLLT